MNKQISLNWSIHHTSLGNTANRLRSTFRLANDFSFPVVTGSSYIHITCQNISHTSSALWRSDVSTAQHCSICLNYCSQSPTWSQGRGCDRHNWLYCACDAPRSATTPSLSPRLEHGTVCLTRYTDCHHMNNSRNTHLFKISFAQQDSF